MATDVLKPTPQLLIKLGSLITHYQEFNSPNGHELDLVTIHSLEKDPDVKEWLKGMDEMALLPKKP
jgi:hypothetical protein